MAHGGRGNQQYYAIGVIMVIQFFKTKDNGEQEEKGRVKLVNGRVTFDGIPGYFLEEWQEFGVLHNGETYFPEDGEKFLEVLPAVYTGSKFRAERGTE